MRAEKIVNRKNNNTLNNQNEIDISNEDIKCLSKLASKKSSVMERRTHGIMCEVLLLNDFKNLVRKMRKKLKIPADGFSRSILLVIKKNPRTIGDIYTENDKKVYVKQSFFETLDRDIFSYIHSKDYFEKYHNRDLYSLDIMTELIREYICFGSVSGSGYLGNITYENNGGEDGYADKIRIEVRPDIRKEELLDFIRDNYVLIKAYNHVANVKRKNKQKRFKISKKFSKDIFIYKKYLEVLSQTKITKETIEEIVAREYNKHFYPKVVSDGTVRTIVQRMREKINLINS